MCLLRPALKLVLFLTATLIALLGAEIVVRSVRDPRPMEVLEQRRVFPTYYPLAEAEIFTRDHEERMRYRLTPGFEMELDGNSYRINTLGFRGSEEEVWDRPGVRRIVLLGDSYAFGLGVDQEDTLSAQLELRLEEPGQPIAVLNLGVPGFHTGQELALAERIGFELDPGLVVLLYCGNDEVGEAFQYDPVYRVLYGDALPVPYVLKGALARSAIYRWLARIKVGRMRAEGEFSPFGGRHWAVTRDRLETLFRACADRGVPLVLANLPILWSSDALRDPDWTGHENYERVARLAEVHGVPWVDLRSVLLAEQEFPEDPFLSRLLISLEPPRDHHLNAAGYSTVADAIARTVLAEGLLPDMSDHH
jgi:lysophospholipase L1-like esterase